MPVTALKGTLVECDASIKAIIMRLNQDGHAYVIEDLDDEHVLVHDDKVEELKIKLKDVLAATQYAHIEDSGSDEDL